jgi:hypothetical protein
MPPRDLSRAAQHSQHSVSDFVSRQLQIYKPPGAPAGRIDNAVRAIIRQEGITYGVYRKALAGQPNWLSFLFRIINVCPQLGAVRQAVIQYLHNQQVNRILGLSFDFFVSQAIQKGIQLPVVVPSAAVLPPFFANPAPNPTGGNNPAPNSPGGNNPPGGNNGGGGNNPPGGNNGGGGNNPPGGNNGAVDGNTPPGAGRNQARRPAGADALPQPILLQPALGFEPPFNVMVIYVDSDTTAMPEPPEGAFLYPYP